MRYQGLKCGLKAGLNKIDTYLAKALVGDYPLLGAGEFLDNSKFGRLLTLEASTTPIYLFVLPILRTLQNGIDQS